MLSSIKVSIFGALIFSVSLPALADYEDCKNILRDGIRDKINSSDTLDYRLVRKHEFCRMASQYKLDSSDFETFARAYAKTTHAHKYNTSAGTSFSLGTFAPSGGGNFSTESNEDDLSLDDKIKWLKANDRAIRDYRTSNCGKEDFSESLQTEAILFSEIANKDVVEAWRTCMLDKLKNGMWVEVLKDDGYDENDTEVTYTVNTYFRSGLGGAITSLSLTHTDNLVTDYRIVETVNGYQKTGNILGQSRWAWGATISSGGNKQFDVRHQDRTHQGKLKVKAMLSTGNPIEQSITFPKRLIPVFQELARPVDTTSIGTQTDPIPEERPAEQLLKSVKLILHVKNDDLDNDSALHIELRRKSDNAMVGIADLPGSPKHEVWMDYTDHTIVLTLKTDIAEKIRSKNELTLSIAMTAVGKDQWIYQLDVPFEFSSDTQNHTEVFSSRETIMYPASSRTEIKEFDCTGN
ncbi:MAG: hypothetical protein ABIQ95_00320 [Bdellovibrionia bacterium]